MKIIKIDMQELYKNDNGDLKMVYDAFIHDGFNSRWVQTMRAYYLSKLDIISEVERPKGIRPQQMEKALLKYLIENEYIKGEK